MYFMLKHILHYLRLFVILDQVNKVSGIHTFLKALHRQKLIQDIFDFFSIYSAIVILDK